MWRSILLLIFLAGCAVSQPYPAAPEAETEAPPDNSRYVMELQAWLAGRNEEPAEKVFDNIQIMKGIPAGRVLRIMENGFAPALGVECGFCHDVDDWASDMNEHKGIAREMWKMNGMIRERVTEIAGPDAAVNCYTCHRGQKKPATSR